MDAHVSTYNMKEKYIRLAGAFLICYVFVVRMVIDASGEWNGLFHYAYILCVFSELSVVFLCIFSLRVDKRALKLVAAYLVWLVLSRPFCGDIKLTSSIELITIVAVCTSIMYYALSLDDAYRRRILAIFFSIICAFYLVIAFSIIYVAVTRTLVRLPFDITVGIKSEGELRYVTAFGQHRNITGQWSCLNFCLIAYLFCVCKNKIMRFFLGISEAIFFVAVALGLCRTSMISLAVAVAMLAAFIVQKALTNKKNATRVVAALLAAIAVLPVAYEMQSAVGAAVEKISQKYVSISGNNVASGAGTVIDAYTGNMTELTEEEALYTETRGSDNVKILGGRVLLWKCVFAVLGFEPERLLHGASIDGYMTLVHIFRKTEEINTHNFLLESLMITGIPGFLLVFSFTAILTIRMIKLFFSRVADDKVKLLTIPLGSLLIRNMGEAQILRTDDITNYLFFFAAGAFLAYSYELFPEKPFMIKMLQKCSGRK